MVGKQSLYDLLGVARQAPVVDIRAAYRQRVEALEAQRSSLAPAEFSDRFQLLRTAYSTLIDPISRGGYDASLDAAMSLATTPPAPSALPAVHADALGLRADSLALRADALMVRAAFQAAEAPSTPLEMGLRGLRRSGRLLALLLLVLAAGAGTARCSAVRTQAALERAAAEHQKAADEAALQDYERTYGIRPANMVELQLLESERQRKEIAERQREAERRRADEAQRQWAEESRRIGQQVSERHVQHLEEERREQQRLKNEAEQLALEIRLATDERERSRLELRLRQLREQLKKP